MDRIFAFFIASRFVFIVFAITAASFVPLQEGYLGRQFDKTAPYLAWIWANFDGRHFLNIATLGYRNFDFAFFPLYPILISGLGYIIPVSHLYLGISISLLTFLAALFVIKKITELDFNKGITNLTIVLTCFFPFAFFYQTVYPDSLFLLLSTASFYFARKKMWVLSGVFGGLTVLDRLSGIALLPGLAVEWYLQNKKPLYRWRKMIIPFLKTSAIPLFLTLLGLLLYMAYLGIAFGDPLKFQKAMTAWRQDEFILLPQVIFRYLKIFLFVDKTQLVFWVALLEFLSFFAYLGLGIYVWRKIRSSYGIFMVALLLLVTFTGTLAGTQRYMLHLFPGFIAMALLLSKRKNIRQIIAVLFFLLGFIFTALFTRGYWIA